MGDIFADLEYTESEETGVRIEDGSVQITWVLANSAPSPCTMDEAVRPRLVRSKAEIIAATAAARPGTPGVDAGIVDALEQVQHAMLHGATTSEAPLLQLIRRLAGSPAHPSCIWARRRCSPSASTG